MKEQAELPMRFSINVIKNDDALLRFHTGLPSFQYFTALADFLRDCSTTTPLWTGSDCQIERRRRDHRSQRTLPLDDELFLTLMKLRLDPPIQDLAMRFAVSQATVSRIFSTWLMLLFNKFKKSFGLPVWPSKERIQRTMSQQFRDLYPSTE